MTGKESLFQYRNPVRVGHLGDVGRFFDNLPMQGAVVRPKSTPWYRRTIFFLPRWFFVLGTTWTFTAGFLFGWMLR